MKCAIMLRWTLPVKVKCGIIKHYAYISHTVLDNPTTWIM